MEREQIAAIILSAGCSSRMGGFKPLLPLGEMTVLERTIRLFQSVGVADIRVVVGHRANDVLPFIKRCGARAVFNDHYREQMFFSVTAGINSLEPARQAFFLLPVDTPLVRRRTLLDLLEAYRNTTNKDIFYPRFNGSQGHPPLIAARCADAIKRWNGQGGLRSFFRQHESALQAVEVADEYILLDLDTPSDYRMMLDRFQRYEIPTVQECTALLTKKFAVNKSVLDHCRKVAHVSRRLGEALNRTGCRLDLALIEAGGLLHDLAKGKPDHAEAGAEIVKQWGFFETADVVRFHQDIHVQDNALLNAAEIVYLADKVVNGDKTVLLEARFQEKMVRYADDPQAQAAIAARLAKALAVKKRVEDTLKQPLETILNDPSPEADEAGTSIPAEAVNI